VNRGIRTVTGVLGELLITVGVVVLLYVSWQLWVGDWIIGAQTDAQGHELAQEWAAAADGPVTPPDPTATADPAEPVEPTEPPPVPVPAFADEFALLHVPRFGGDYARTVAAGVAKGRILDEGMIGYYPDTQLPGEVGNFAIAAHRTTYGAPFAGIADLRIGDAIVVETPAGWYTYRFRTLEYVRPDAVEVLLPVPQALGEAGADRYITLTSCSPRYSNAERIIAYGVFDSFQPRAAGAPASLAPVGDA
jgi:sortase A